jgi:hypothetical protein
MQTMQDADPEDSPPIPTPELKPLLCGMYVEACRRPWDENKLEAAIADLLRYLGTEAGHTRGNCWAVGNFIISGDEHWEEDWDELPERFVDVLGIMGHELLESCEDPEWAESFGGTPQQILEHLLKPNVTKTD